MRRHISVHEVQAGARVFVIPRDASTPRGPKLDPIPKGGMEVVVTDYIFGCMQRGSVTAYGPEEVAEPTAPAAAEPAPADGEVN